MHPRYCHVAHKFKCQDRKDKYFLKNTACLLCVPNFLYGMCECMCVIKYRCAKARDESVNIESFYNLQRFRNSEYKDQGALHNLAYFNNFLFSYVIINL